MSQCLQHLAVLRSSFVTSALRYSRSWGLWLLLLVAPIGARFMISDESGKGFVIAVNGQLPVLTAPVLGVWLGVVVTTTLLPAAYIYLRANINRRQPWQVEEVTAAPRTAMLLGRFAADAAVLLGALGALTIAGWFLGWLMIADPLNPLATAYTLWLVAAPALIGLAALRILFDALPWLRGALGDLVYFFLWILSIVAPIAVANQPSSYAVNLTDFAGFVRPLVGAEPASDAQIAIGGSETSQGRISLDVFKGLHSPGYIAARFTWIGIALLVVVFAGLIYRPHQPLKQRSGKGGRVARWLAAGPPPMANPRAPSAQLQHLPWAGLVQAEFRLIGKGRLFLLLAALAAIAGLWGDYRHVGSPVGLLLLVFAYSAHAGRSEARGLLKLSSTTLLSPWIRRGAFVLAGTAWSFLLAIPAALARGSAEPLVLAVGAGAAASITAAFLAALTGSSFAPRVVLLIGWYAYLSS
jgi:hypothetical protein